MELHKLLETAERERVEALATIDTSTQTSLGQYFTPEAAAKLIASLLVIPTSGLVRVLDPGAGSGILSAALIERILCENSSVSVDLVAIERDPALIPHLKKTLHACEQAAEGRVKTQVIAADFILDSTGIAPTLNLDSSFDLVIENPPYKKLAASSSQRKAMRLSGVDVPNLYAAFLSLSIAALKSGGQLAAITPRSFFNGPYFGQFRMHFLDSMTLDRIHVFDSRASVFSDTGVLQENVIVVSTRGKPKSNIVLSSSRDHKDAFTSRVVPFEAVVHPDDPHKFIRVVSQDEDIAVAEFVMAQPCTLDDLGIQVSTGKVVDFRSRASLSDRGGPGAHPLVYPGNLKLGVTDWPREIRKPQWFIPSNGRDKSMLLPPGWYPLVKRFSSKEEKRRIVTATWSPDDFPGSVAFENHLNVFHINNQGLDEKVAKGLSMWLNSSIVDRFFRTFSGHTQVNATDLRTLRFPKIEVLKDLGTHSVESQEEIDRIIAERLAIWRS